MKSVHGYRWAAVAAAAVTLLACAATIALDPIFIQGRAVSAAGDSLLAVTRAGHRGVFVRGRRNNDVTELGADVLQSPQQLQWLNGEWYVSDVETGKPWLVVLSPTGDLKRRIPLEEFTKTPHQFAVLPDGRIVVESPEGALVALAGDSSVVFTVTDRAAKPGLVVGAAGGVLHAVPDKYITLYNHFGHIRWRLEWPWASTAYVTQIAVDPNGRLFVLAGVPGDGTFIVYAMSNLTGEILSWSPSSRAPTFIVDRLGKIKSEDAEKWFR